VEENQLRLRGSLRTAYDFIVCGSGSSGAVVARRLAENPDVSVLLIEAGGSDSAPEVEMAAAWPLNLGSARDWGFTALPNPHLNGRAIPMSMGKVLGGRVEHQRHALGSRPQDRLGLFRCRGRRSRLEL
jgi:choline dehydrogenase